MTGASPAPHRRSAWDSAPAFNSPTPDAQGGSTRAPLPATAPTLGTIAIGALRANVGARSALARDNAPLVNGPTQRGTVNRRVAVPETKGRLLTASRFLSPRGHD